MVAVAAAGAERAVQGFLWAALRGGSMKSLELFLRGFSPASAVF